ncbi:FAD-dependent oxidoreductase [Gluconacetobacter entanii]|uniref:FAD-dependent oxidoreductase n=1 Tax=Gluconacetobacter entanii TaxID=108528 RepID=A0ABT3K4A2_9PROT|nr:FAD-dependent oxidoreductase [Gluconacetobacter entanii]MCW4590232.1 FAD-dependent oxidoreductase [Gluconacetobacter entanii]MCW4594295.1 FAD-dependent oxidoreductase [Gluconacetobacter entanii]NPC89478.1 FAD-dependent oxidoreductase [Gluconacetobacter entanii]
MPAQRNITVIGGGVTGLATAYALLRDGHAVTLLERHGDVGEEASFANGGQLSYRYVHPLADAGVPRESLSWLLQAGSPISLRLRADPHQWRWMLAFLRACNSTTNARNSRVLLQLALRSQDELGRWRSEGLKDFLWRQPGKLVVYRNAAKFRKAAAGVSNPELEQVLSPTECARVEPAFAALAPKLAGGIFSPADEVADCYRFCLSLRDAMTAMPSFTLLRGQASLGAGANGRCDVMVDGRAHDTDLVVLAAGVGSRQMARPLGFDLPLYGLKGYSLTANSPAGTMPDVSVTDYDNRVVYARLGDALRIAAMVDIGARDASINPHRIARLRALASETLPQAGPYDTARPWAGLRPATPSGVPIIARTRYPNLLFNVGQGALGFTLSVGSALRIRDLVRGTAAASLTDAT